MSSSILVFGATGRTGQHFVRLLLAKGHNVKGVVRDPGKLSIESSRLQIVQGSIAEELALDELLQGVDAVVMLLGDAARQREGKVNAEFTKRLIPAMRRKRVSRLLYQAGGFTRPYKQRLPFSLWLLRNTIARFGGLIGQHEDNEAVIEYLVEEASDITWVVHRAAIGSDGPSKGTLQRSTTRLSVATFRDCADYSYRLLSDDTAVHTCDLSCYAK
jgi:NAD(P)-dependent dehydrogenase (short-subunit alcohol dehydrogenase family)